MEWTRWMIGSALALALALATGCKPPCDGASCADELPPQGESGADAGVSGSPDAAAMVPDAAPQVDAAHEVLAPCEGAWDEAGELTFSFEDGSTVCGKTGQEATCNDGEWELVGEPGSSPTCGATSEEPAERCEVGEVAFGEGNEVCFRENGLYRCNGNDEWLYLSAFCDQLVLGASCVSAEGAAFSFDYADHERDCFSDGNLWQCQNGRWQEVGRCADGDDCVAGDQTFDDGADVCFGVAGRWSCVGGAWVEGAESCT